MHPDDGKIITLFPKLPRIIRTEEDLEKWEKHHAQLEVENQKRRPVWRRRVLFSGAIVILAFIGIILLNQFMPDGAWRVIVKSGVWKIDSSGGLIDVCHFDSIVEFHSSNHLGQIIEPS